MKKLLLLVYCLSFFLNETSARKGRGGLHANPKITGGLLKGLHVAEGIAASGALGPEFKAAAVAAQTAETAINGIAKGESMEQIAKESAMTAASSTLGGLEGGSGGNLKQQLAGMAINAVQNKINSQGDSNNDASGAADPNDSGNSNESVNPSNPVNNNDQNNNTQVDNVNRTQSNVVKQPVNQIRDNISTQQYTNNQQSTYQYHNKNKPIIDPQEQEPVLLQVQQPPMILHVQPPPVFILHQPHPPTPRLQPQPQPQPQLQNQSVMAYGTPAIPVSEQAYKTQFSTNNYVMQMPNPVYGIPISAQNYPVQSPTQTYGIQPGIQLPVQNQNYESVQMPAQNYNAQQFTSSPMQAQQYPYPYQYK